MTTETTKPSSESRKKVLIVDDEPNVRNSLRLLLKANFDVDVAEDGLQALTHFDDFQPDIVLMDVAMPNLDGLGALQRLREKNREVPVVMLTATTTVKTAVEAMKQGAADYLNKPFDVEELSALIVTLLSKAPTERDGGESASSSAKSDLPGDFGPMVGRSAPMQDLFTRIGQVAERDTSILITGESGTGKELVARRIHELSRRKSGPFIAINCGAIPETLIESELFGHEKGAFTHAVERRIGYCELANNGTLFLDEIGELNPAVQVKLLRFLQEQEFYRVGRSKPVRVDVRIICATNKNLEELMKQKLFRQDLFYRINVISIAIPPLRDRFEDIPRFVEHFIKRLSPVYAGRSLALAPEVLQRLVQYDWPGNVRELENVVESLIALCPGPEVTVDDLPAKLKGGGSTMSLRMPTVGSGMKFEEAERLFESEMIVKALRKANYVQTRAAEILGISRRILKYKMDKLGISDQPSEGSAAVPSVAEGSEDLSGGTTKSS